MFPLLVLLPFVIFAAERAPSQDSNCYDSVLFHRGESILPSTDLFCVVHSNAETENSELPIIQTEEQWWEFVSSNPSVEQEATSPPVSPPVLTVRRNGQVSEFLLPSRYIDSKCSGIQKIAVGYSQTIACTADLGPFSESECVSNEFLSAALLFESPLVSSQGNVSYETMFRSDATLQPSRWANGQCENVLQQAHMHFTLNKTAIVDAQLISVSYATLTVANHTQINQKFIIAFENAVKTSEKTKEDSYERGQEIYAMNDEDGAAYPFSLPFPRECESASRAPVRFLVNSTSSCIMRVSRCAEAQQVIRQFVEEFVPVWIRRTPTSNSTAANETNALVIRRNRTQLEIRSSSEAECSLNTDFSFIFYYAKEGRQQDHRVVIVSATYRTEARTVRLESNATLVLRFTVQFRDATSPLVSRFASLPHIDLRLPSDFFYPFLGKSTAHHFHFLLVPLLIACVIATNPLFSSNVH
ncbi:hypothetical protein Q1695_006291 [Nippostrongylus brasiliensis]|nr:hypothetical protein Q1695_006291 [Nippostrongylus brasiliensis]